MDQYADADSVSCIIFNFGYLPGGGSGFKERDALLDYLKELDPKKYLVILSSYYNRPKNPPIPVLIRKL